MNNPQAFPQTVGTNSGITLRDYFAAKAMQAFIQASAVMSVEPRDETIAEWAYWQADAMLAERDNEPDLVTDAKCFRFWVSEAARSPASLAQAIAHCVTEQDYRDVIIPMVQAADSAIDKAKGHTK